MESFNDESRIPLGNIQAEANISWELGMYSLGIMRGARQTPVLSTLVGFRPRV